MAKKKKEEKIDLHNLKPEEQLKYEIAEELGLLPKVLENGWKTLSAKETGKIGGLMTKRKKEMKAALETEKEEQKKEYENGKSSVLFPFLFMVTV